MPFGPEVPLVMHDFGCLEWAQRWMFLVQGKQDKYGVGEALRSFVERMSAWIMIRTITRVDHYSNDHFKELQGTVREYFTGGPGAAPFLDPGST